jgi:hypothetical protein
MRSGERDLQLDVSLPADARAPLPAVVFLNGIGVGRWRRGAFALR